jgi:acyl carrier protein
MRNTHCHSNSAEDRVKDIILHHTVEIWEKADLTPNLSFLNDGLGFDSVEVVELIDECEEVFHIRIFSEFLEKPPLTVGKLISFIERHREERSRSPL